MFTTWVLIVAITYSGSVAISYPTEDQCRTAAKVASQSLNGVQVICIPGK
jgi:hypothetical protein